MVAGSVVWLVTGTTSIVHRLPTESGTGTRSPSRPPCPRPTPVRRPWRTVRLYRPTAPHCPLTVRPLPPSGQAWTTLWTRGTLRAVSPAGVLLVARRHVDLVRVASALCRPVR
ncbi:putative leader peptide [Amycolatopsis sp. NBC_01480]|uniref:putative leader peptide n=1 Tax=Amycolatopsis sp. NBC_01480 TaxID=2903562 RepID=UPI003FA49F1C